jgi:hypothetical protein
VVPPPVWPRRRAAREAAERRFSRTLMDAAPADVDLVWERHSAPCDGPMRWCRERGIPRWLEVNAPVCLERALTDPLGAPRWANRIEGDSVRSADRCLVVSRWLVPWADALGAKEVLHLPNGTDARPIARQNRPENPVLAFFGSCQPWHRLDRLPALLEAVPHATALVVGDGPAPPPRHPRIAHVGPGNAASMVHVDVGLVLGGHPWVNPLKIADYRAIGLPVVSVPVGDAALAIGEGGTVVPWGPLFPQAVRDWIGASPRAHVRSWDDVVADAFQSAQGLSRG